MSFVPGSEHPEFLAARNATLDRVITIASERIQVVRHHIFTEDQLFHDREMGPERHRNMELDAVDCAEREAWNLILQGFKHLRNGGPGGKPGMVSFAASKATLRNSALANSLGIKPPRFVEIPREVKYHTGHEEALLECQGMITDLHRDAPRSKKIIEKTLMNEDMAEAFGVDATSPRDLRRLFKIVQKKTGIAPPKDAEDYREKFQQDIRSLHGHIIYAFELLHKAYVQTCEELDTRLRHFPAESTQIKPPRFDA